MSAMMAATREQMKATPFAPLDSTDYAARQTHAAEYTAFYIGETEKNLERIAVCLENNVANSSKIVAALAGLQTIFPNIMKE